MIWAFSAFAASWTVAEPLVGVLGADGRVEQPAGVGFRIESEALPAVWDQAGAAVDLVPVEGGWLLPAADRSRALSIVLAHPERARFRRSDSPAEIGAWLAWDRAAWRAIHRGGPLPTPPSDSARTSASLRLRSAAVGPELAWLGLQADTAADRPWSRVSHVPGPELGLVGELTVQGPGFAILRVKLREGPLTRFVLLPTVDGQALDAVPLASTGAAPLSTRIWLPPGRHRIGARVEGATPETLSLQPMPLRPTLFRPVSLPALREGVDRAEWLWLSGHRAEAALAFAPFAEEAGPRGDLARARLLALAQDPAEAARRAAVEAGSPDGRELLADAALRVAELLDPETVARLVAGAADPDLVALARWLDRLGGTRPRGVALLQAAAAANPAGAPYGAQAVREAGLVSRWTRLAPDEGAIQVDPAYATAPPGIARIRMQAGESLELDLPVAARNRFPVLRLRAGRVRFRLDGRELVSPGGALDFALSAGEHRLELLEGELILLDPEVARGGTRVWEQALVALPASWTLPDPAWTGELRLDVQPAVPVRLRVGARELRLSPRADGAYPSVLVHGGESQVRIEGEGAATLSLRTLVASDKDLRPAPVTELGPAMAELDALTAAIDAGDVGARERRASLLAGLGQLTAARRDLARLHPRSPEELARIGALWEDLAPPVPSAALPGPRSVAAALAWAGRDLAAPADAESLARLAAETDASMLWQAAAEAWLASGDLVAATVAANRAADPDRGLLDDIEARTKWSAVTLPDRAAGILPATALRPSRGGFWREVREVLLRSPWPEEEAVVLRGSSGDVQRHSGRSLVVELFCRDEGAVERPCELPVRVGDRAELLRAGDGRQDRRLWTLGPGRHELELGGPGTGLAAVVRVSVDGVVVPPQRTRRALQASPTVPVELTVAGPALLRLRVLRGKIQTEAGPLGAGEAPLLLPVVGTRTLRFSGDADLVADLGTLQPGAPAAAPPLPPPAPPPLLADTELLPLLTPLVRRLPEARLPGAGPTWRSQLAWHHEEVDAPGREWDTVELSQGLAWSSPGWWTWAELWGRAPAPAAGVVAQGGRVWDSGLLGLEGRFGWALGVPDGESSATAAQLQLLGRQELELGASSLIRAQLRARGGTWSPEPEDRVDLRAWTRWDADHPFFADLSLGWIAAPTTDLRFGLGARATSNSFGDPMPLDAIGPWATSDLLVGDWVFSFDASVRHKPADLHRGAPLWWSDLNLGLRRGLWEHHRFWEAWAFAALVQGQPEAHVGLSVYWTDGRGFYDLAPGLMPFRTAREGRIEGD